MSGVEWVEIDANHAGQRIDNFLLARLKGVPKSRIYRILRKGEVRVNKKRVKPEYKLQNGDKVRVPPVRTAEKEGAAIVIPASIKAALESPLFEDDALLIVNKPSGLAVHGGSGLAWGAIEALRTLRPELAFLELAHRLDRATSGVLILAKSRPALLGIQAQLRRESARKIEKSYLAVLGGVGLSEPQTVTAALSVTRNAEGKKQSVVRDDAAAQPAKSVFLPMDAGEGWQQVRIQLFTGRMHQARAHAKAIERPILGDPLYGDWQANKAAQQRWQLRRTMLHSESYAFDHPVSGERMSVKATMADDMQAVLAKMRESEANGATDDAADDA